MDVKWSGDYLDIISPEGYQYECVDEPDMVLAFPKIGGKYIVRKEVCPAYTIKGKDQKYWTMISGTMEKGESPLQTLRREMGEETPVKPNRIRLIDRKEKFPLIKLTTCRASLYHFEVLDYEETEAPGDGSDVEKESSYAFLTPEEIKAVSQTKNCDFTLMYCSQII